jgi:ketosteroid isomerase-like protein
MLPTRRRRSQGYRGSRCFLLGWVIVSFLAPWIAVFTGCKTASTSGGGNPTDLTYLRTAPEEWDRLFNLQDTSKLSALYAEDAISMPFNAPTVRGRKAIASDRQQFFTQNTGKHETFVDEILTHEDWAIERARYTLTYAPKPSGPERKETGRQVMCRRKINGIWLIAWEIWNTDMPAVK